MHWGTGEWEESTGEGEESTGEWEESTGGESSLPGSVCGVGEGLDAELSMGRWAGMWVVTEVTGLMSHWMLEEGRRSMGMLVFPK